MESTLLSGNDVYCLAQKNFSPGSFVLGNSTYSSAFIATSAKSFGDPGIELKQATEVSRTGWMTALQRMQSAVDMTANKSIIAIHCYSRLRAGFLEYLALGSSIEREEYSPSFLTTMNGQELYTYLDTGYTPVGVALGNVVYSSGASPNLKQNIQVLAQGEIETLSENFTHLRYAVLNRLIQQAQQQGANAVLGIKAAIYPFGKAAEMIMHGAACQTQLPALEVITSNLSAAEVWSLAQLGYAPQQLLISSVVYAVGLAGSWLGVKSFFRGESPQLSALLQAARAKVLLKLNQQAQNLGAEKIIGIKIYTQPLANGAIEFIAMGTAITRLAGVKTLSSQLPAQAFMPTEETFYSELSSAKQNPPTHILLRFLLILLIAGFLLWLGWGKN
jgi:uncharacterized protein YbjQ (UPF0145 family)